MHPRAAELVTILGLQPHPEGGYYRELFRSARGVVPDDDRGRRSALTTIHFLLAEGMRSRWHVVGSDEVWHLYEGGPLELVTLDMARGDLARHRLAPVGRGSDGPVHTVPAGVWQAARPLGDYVLAGCTVGPGFEFADFAFMADDPAVVATVRDRWPEAVAFV